MPYDLANPPEKLRGLPENKQRQWIHVYDSCMKEHGDDIKCQKMAWGVTHGWRDKEGKEFYIEIEEGLPQDSKAIEEMISKTLGMAVELKEK